MEHRGRGVQDEKYKYRNTNVGSKIRDGMTEKRRDTRRSRKYNNMEVEQKIR